MKIWLTILTVMSLSLMGCKIQFVEGGVEVTDDDEPKQCPLLGYPYYEGMCSDSLSIDLHLSQPLTKLYTVELNGRVIHNSCGFNIEPGPRPIPLGEEPSPVGSIAPALSLAPPVYYDSRTQTLYINDYSNAPNEIDLTVIGHTSCSRTGADWLIYQVQNHPVEITYIKPDLNNPCPICTRVRRIGKVSLKDKPPIQCFAVVPAVAHVTYVSDQQLPKALRISFSMNNAGVALDDSLGLAPEYLRTFSTCSLVKDESLNLEDSFTASLVLNNAPRVANILVESASSCDKGETWSRVKSFPQHQIIPKDVVLGCYPTLVDVKLFEFEILKINN